MSSPSSLRRSDASTVKVLYIGGCGRSGSTLLDRMLGQIPGVCSLGEVGQLWRALRDNQECGCGTPIRDCSFWDRVGERVFGGWQRVDLVALERMQSEAARQRHALLMLAPRAWPPYARRLARYTDVLCDLYRGIQDVSGARLLVNSTKHYWNALCLAHAVAVDLHVTHLVRDSRGVAYSWSKTVAKPEAAYRGAWMHRYGTGRSARRWLGYNSCFEALRSLGVPSTLVRYEDVVRVPRQSIEQILEHAGVPVERDAFSFLNGREVVLRPNHTVAGNPMRFRVGTIALRMDDEWKRKLPPRDRRLISLLTWPLLVRYGYGSEG